MPRNVVPIDPEQRARKELLRGVSVSEEKPRHPGQYVKGQSGNPKGYPKALAELQGLAKLHTPAAIEKLNMALSYCVEASAKGLYKSTIEATRHAVEAATELGTHRSDGIWASVAALMDQCRVALASMTSARFQLLSPFLSAQFEEIRTKVGNTVHRRLVH